MRVRVGGVRVGRARVSGCYGRVFCVSGEGRRCGGDCGRRRRDGGGGDGQGCVGRCRRCAERGQWNGRRVVRLGFAVG